MADEESAALPEPACLPWHRTLTERLTNAWHSQRLPHAMLLHGAEGVGKRNFAMWLAFGVLCEAPERSSLAPCGQCTACKLMRAGTHPDMQWIRPEEDKQQVSIEQIRVANQKLSHTSARHRSKIAVIEPAEQMTNNAANSLLKTLEEPTPNSLLILIAAQPSALAATIRSRCQQFEIATPDAETVQRWSSAAGVALPSELLEFCSGAPLNAVAYAQSGQFEDLNDRMIRAVGDLLTGKADATQIGPAWADERVQERLRWLDLWLSQRVRAWICGSDESITFPKRAVPLPTGGPPLNITAVYEVIDRIRQLRAQLSKIALQRELAMESLLLELQRVLRPSQRQVA